MCEIKIEQEKSKQWRLWGPKRDWLVAPVGSERTLASSRWAEDKSTLCDSCPAGGGLSVGRSDSQQKLKHFS